MGQRSQLLAVAAALFVFVVVQVAVAGSSEGGPQASASKRFKKLKQRVAALEARVDQVGQVPLTGADIDESSLAQVPSAAQADTAANADLLDGMNSTDFASSADVHTPSRLALDDTTAGDNDPTTATLVDNGAFQVGADCFDDLGANNTDIALVDITFTNSSLSSRSTNGVDWDFPSSSGFANLVIFSEPNGGNVNTVESANFIAVPESGDALSGFVSAELNDPDGGGSDCTFGVSLLG